MDASILYTINLMIYLSSNFPTHSIHYKSETIANIHEDVIVITTEQSELGMFGVLSVFHTRKFPKLTSNV